MTNEPPFGFGFGPSDRDPDRDPDREPGPQNPFGFGGGIPGLPGGMPGMPPGGVDVSQLGQMLTQLGQMLSQAQNTGGGPVNYDLAANIAKQTGVEIVTWAGSCIVHEQFTPRDIQQIRDENPGIVVLAHPECPPEVVEVADLSGSTAQMSDYVASAKPKQVALITECSMADNVCSAFPETEFVRPCNLCPHMQRITLRNIHDCLEQLTPQIDVPHAIGIDARRSVQRMLDLDAARRS